MVIGGLAIDIGTTTVSAVLINMENGEILAKSSAGNGQIRFGADVIKRIVESQKPGGQKKLQDAVIKETINPMIHEMCKSAKFPKDHIYRMCVASNTTMNHLFAGIMRIRCVQSLISLHSLRPIPFLLPMWELISIKMLILLWRRISEAM